MALENQQPPPPECTDNSQCPQGQQCVNNHCVPIPPPPNQTVIFRTNVINGNYNTQSAGWIAFDQNQDLIMEPYGRTTSSCTEFRCNTPGNAPYGGLTVHSTSLFVRNFDIICACQTGATGYPKKYSRQDSDAQGAVLNSQPTEPYTTNGQERLA